MKKTLIVTALAAAGLLYSFKSIEASSWSIDKSHARLGFSISHMMVSEVEGSFKKVDAKIDAPKEDFSDAVVELTAEAASVSTDNEKRDEHLKGADFFDVTKFTTVTFKSKSFKKESENNYVVVGDLTMHGVTKSVTLNAVCKTGTNPMSKKAMAGFKITGKVKRSDFGIGGSMPTAILGEEVSILANAEFVKN